MSNEVYDSLIRSPLFREENRGGTAINDAPAIETKKLGICEEEYTPLDLINYFESPHESAQNWFEPDCNSLVGRWFVNYMLPIITGASGTARDFLSKIALVHAFDREALRVVMTGLAATLVAKGHHSYFEIFIVLARMGYPLKKTETMFDFYAQTLPQSILDSKAFAAFKSSNSIVEELIEMPFDADEVEIQRLPCLSKY